MIVTAARRYVLGLSVVTVIAMTGVLVAPVAARAAMLWALGVALFVQAPLGWMVVRNLGTERFLAAWAVGFVVRLAAVGCAAILIAPRAGLALAPFLFTLVGILMAFVAVEAIGPVERFE